MGIMLTALVGIAGFLAVMVLKHSSELAAIHERCDSRQRSTARSEAEAKGAVDQMNTTVSTLYSAVRRLERNVIRLGDKVGVDNLERPKD